MIVGIGTDIVRVERIGKLSTKALERILTPNEKEYCERYSRWQERAAGRFAAKEAIVKALGTGISGGIAWHQLEILPNAAGAPQVAFFGAAAARLAELGSTHCHITISHESIYAVAFAVIESFSS